MSTKSNEERYWCRNAKNHDIQFDMKVRFDRRWNENIMRSNENVKMFWKFSKNAILFVRSIFRIENKRSNADCAIQSFWNRFLESFADKLIDLNLSFWFWCLSCIRDKAYDDKRVVAKVFEREWHKESWKRKKIDNWIKIKLNSLRIRSISIQKTNEKKWKKKKNWKKKFWQQNILISLKL